MEISSGDDSLHGLQGILDTLKPLPQEWIVKTARGMKSVKAHDLRFEATYYGLWGRRPLEPENPTNCSHLFVHMQHDNASITAGSHQGATDIFSVGIIIDGRGIVLRDDLRQFNGTFSDSGTIYGTVTEAGGRVGEFLLVPDDLADNGKVCKRKAVFEAGCSEAVKKSLKDLEPELAESWHRLFGFCCFGCCTGFTCASCFGAVVGGCLGGCFALANAMFPFGRDPLDMPTIFTRAADILLSDGHPKLAMELADDMLREHPHNGKLSMVAANAAHLCGFVEYAKWYCKHGLEGNPDNADLAGLNHHLSRKRVAVLVGNSKYKHYPALHCAEKDVADLAETLQGMGFDEVHTKYDLTSSGFDEIKQLVVKSVSGSHGAIILFYFAGHAEDDEGNEKLGGLISLIPTNAKPDSRNEKIVLPEFIRDIVEIHKPAIADKYGCKPATNFFLLCLLDCCRNAPTEQSSSSRAAGLDRIIPVLKKSFPQTAGQKMIVYACDWMHSAWEDLDEGHGRFTSQLLTLIDKPVPLTRLVEELTQSVQRNSRCRQRVTSASSSVEASSLILNKFVVRGNFQRDNDSSSAASSCDQFHALAS